MTDTTTLQLLSLSWRNISTSFEVLAPYDMDAPRRCYKCEQTMPTRAFPVSKGKLRNICRECYNGLQRSYWRNKNPCKVARGHGG